MKSNYNEFFENYNELFIKYYEGFYKNNDKNKR